MKFSEFRKHTRNLIQIILADLDKLQAFADQVSFETTTIETTQVFHDGSVNGHDGSSRISRCTIPMTMVCFSTIDMIGQWLKENNDDDFGSSAHTFLSILASVDDLKNENAQIKLRRDFRNGIMHSFFARESFGVSYSLFGPNSLFFDSFGRGSTLNVKFLMSKVRAGLNKFLFELNETQSEITDKAYKGFLLWKEREA